MRVWQRPEHGHSCGQPDGAGGSPMAQGGSPRGPQTRRETLNLAR